MNYFTYTMTSGSLTINSSDGVLSLSLQASASSSCTVLGNTTFQGLEPNAITISNGQGLTLSQESPSNPINNIVITWVSGTVDIVLGK